MGFLKFKDWPQKPPFCQGCWKKSGKISLNLFAGIYLCRKCDEEYWKKETSGFYIRKRIRKMVKDRDKVCVTCGDKGDLIHHKDFSKNNHDPDNLAFLCISCHNGIHHTKHAEKPSQPS